MSKKIRAVLIDPVARTVTDIEIEKGLSFLYKAIGCRTVTRVELDDQNDLWLDDDGLLHTPQPDKFTIGRYPQPLAGVGLVCGYDGEGNTISTRLDADKVRPLICWKGAVHVQPEVVFMSWNSVHS